MLYFTIEYYVISSYCYSYLFYDIIILNINMIITIILYYVRSSLDLMLKSVRSSWGWKVPTGTHDSYICMCW